MFSYIDGKLITCFQWVVRQVELYSAVTKKHLLAWALEGFRLFSFAEMIGGGFLIFRGRVSLGLVIILFALIMIALCVAMRYEVMKPDPPSGMLSDTVVEDKGIRIAGLCSVLLLLFLKVVTIPHDVSLEMITRSIPLLIFSCLVAVMYLLCTTSLPPGEKERHKREAEMYNSVMDSV